MTEKTYVITGASSDVGVNVLESLETDGEKAVAYCQYNSNNKELLEMKRKFQNIDIRPICCNLASIEGIEYMIARLLEFQICPTHILHLAARRFEYMRLKDFDYSRASEEMNIQVYSFAMLLKEFLPVMKKNGYGKIAVMLTAYTIGVPPKYMSDYMIVKHALLGLVKAAASEYAGTGITVNGLSTNMIETGFLANIDQRMVEMNAGKSAMHRNISIDEVTAGLRFLLSDGSDYMTGNNMNMTGGDRM